MHRQDQLKSHTGKDKETRIVLFFSYNFTFIEGRGRAEIVRAIILVQVRCYERSKEGQRDLYPRPGSFNI